MRLLAILAVCGSLTGCIPAPEWYAPPVQRFATRGSEPRGLGEYVNLGDPLAPEYFVEDIVPGAPGDVWRWTKQNPTLKFFVPDKSARRFLAVIALPEATFKQTGPVTLRLLVNGRMIATTPIRTPGRHEMRWPVPAEALRPAAENVVRMELDKVYVAGADEVRLGMVLESAGFVK